MWLNRIRVPNKVEIAVGAVLGFVLVAGIQFLVKRRTKKDQVDLCVPNFQHNVVYLFQFPPSQKMGPNSSPFTMKVENYLKMTKIPYITPNGQHYMKPSKRKLPFIELNGTRIEDSTFIIHHLEAKFNVSLDKNLTAIEKAQSLAWKQLLEQHLYWILLYHRWVHPQYSIPFVKAITEGAPLTTRLFVSLVYCKGVQQSLHAQGMGRHNEDELSSLALEDIQAISTFLGDKKYFFGDDITSIDVTLHAFLCNIYLVEPYTPLKEYVGKIPNLVEYIQRINNVYWK